MGGVGGREHVKEALNGTQGSDIRPPRVVVAPRGLAVAQTMVKHKLTHAFLDVFAFEKRSRFHARGLSSSLR